MDIIIILVITALVALYIALPFFLRQRRNDTAQASSESISLDPRAEKLTALNNQRDALYSAIRDIDFDYGLGKLSKEDFEELSVKYKSEAASVLMQIDEIEKQAGIQSLDQDIEKEILSHRKSTLSDDQEIENEIAAFRAGADKSSCPECGAQYGAQDLFCSKCGAKLK